jgi:hypothetical protein
VSSPLTHAHSHHASPTPLFFDPQAIAERRAQLVDEQKELKQKFEPEAYARLVAADVAAGADDALK